MNHACPHCLSNLKGRLVGHRHVNMLRAELLCPSCRKPIEINKNTWEVLLQPLIWLPGLPLFKLMFSDDAPAWAWILTGVLAALSIFAGWYIWKNRLKEWPRYAKAKTP